MAESIPHPPIASHDEWRAARVALLREEKALTRRRDEVNALRRRLPMEPVTTAYTFRAPEGDLSLPDLFDGKRQLIVYHFMFDPAWDEGCPGCTAFVDALGDLSMLAERDTAFTLVSRAPLEKLQAYREKRGWDRRWVSSGGSPFNYDFHATTDPSVAPIEYNYRTGPDVPHNDDPETASDEQHGISVFFRLEGKEPGEGEEPGVFHTYSAYARGCESLTDAYQLLDITPYGRQEDFEDSPEGWPQRPTYG